MLARTIVLPVVLAIIVTGCSRSPRESSQLDTARQQSSPVANPVAAQQVGAEVHIQPSPVTRGEPVNLKLKLKDRSGKPLGDANVKAVFVMTMGESEMRDQIELNWNGAEYAGTYTPSMSGEWDVLVEARKNGRLLISMPSTITVK